MFASNLISFPTHTVTQTALILDDSDIDRRVYRRYLESHRESIGEILEAATLESALSLWHERHPDFALVDLNLPDGNGIEFLEAIAPEFPDRNLPVIILTGQGNEKMAVQAMKLGVIDYLLKQEMTPQRLGLCLQEMYANPSLMWHKKQTNAQLQQRNQFLENQINEYETYVKILADREKKYRAYFEQNSQFMVTLSPEGYVIEANQTALQYQSLSGYEIINVLLWETPWWHGDETAKNHLTQAINQACQEKRIHFELGISNTEKQNILMDFCLCPLWDEAREINLFLLAGSPLLLSPRLASAPPHNLTQSAPSPSLPHPALSKTEPQKLVDYLNWAQPVGYVGCGEWDLLQDTLHWHQKVCQIDGLTQKEAYLRSLLRVSGLGTWEYDIQTHEMIWTEETFHIFGKEPQPHMPQLEEIINLFLPGDREFFQDFLDRTQRTGKTHDCYARIYHKNGSISHLILHSFTLHNGAGEVVRILGTVQDITSYKLLEQELQKEKEDAVCVSQAKSNFLAFMSHEIRTPINAIVCLIYLLQKTGLTPVQIEYLNKIEISSQNLLKIVNDVLDFSKIEAGKLDLESTPFRLDDLFQNLHNILEVKAKEKGLCLDIEIAQDIPPYLMGDSLRLSQVLMNLLGNAIKFTEHGRVAINVQVIDRTAQAVKLQFAIQDTGIGIHETQKNAIFEAFTQAETSTSRKYNGTGLGLAICKRLVHLMGGSLTVESTPNQGSTFTLQITFDYVTEKTSTLVIENNLENLNVLIADDQEMIRDSLREILQSLACRVTVADSGWEVLELLYQAASQDPFQLVIIDGNLSGLDGISVSRQIKGGSVLMEIPKIILMTTVESDQTAAITIPSDIIDGIDGILEKPFNRLQVWEIITNIVADLPPFSLASVLPKNSFVNVLSPLAQGFHVLLVEDNEINQKIVVELLHQIGVTVDIAGGGTMALERVQSRAYDLVLMDIGMPDIDGLEVTRTIRQWAEPKKPQTERFAHLPIVAMTAYAMGSDREKSLAAGMNDYLSKPIDVNIFYQVLKRWMNPQGMVIPSITSNIVPEKEGIFLPELPGIDVESALERVRGNGDLYCRLLRQFCDAYSALGLKIEAALQEEDWHQAAYFVHSLRGSVGNLGIRDLYDLTILFEQQLREQWTIAPSPRSVQELRQIHADMMALSEQKQEAILAWCAIVSPEEGVTSMVIPGDLGDWERGAAMRSEILGLVDALIALVETDTGEALTYFAKLAALVRSTDWTQLIPCQAKITLLEKHLMNFELAQSLEVLRCIRQYL